MTEDPRRILVIRLSSLGDVVLTGPVFEALRRRFPRARLLGAVKRAYADVLIDTPEVDEVLVLEPGESIFTFLRRVRRVQADLVVDLHANLRSRIITMLSGARRRLRYRKAALGRRLFVRWRWPSEALRRHTLERYLAALAPLDIQPPGGGLGSIVVIQTAFLGDAVLTTPLLDALRRLFPEARVAVVTTPDVAEVFRSHHSAPEVILFDKRGRERSWTARLRFAGELRRRAFEAAVIPHRSLTSALLAWWARVPRRVGFSRSQGRWLLTDVVPFEWGVHDVDRNLRLLERLGGRAAPARLRLTPDGTAVRMVRRRLSAAGRERDQRLLGINAGSVWPTKRWRPEGFAAVADRAASELRALPVFVGGPSDRAIVAEILSRMKERSLDWTGQTTLRELIALISQCGVFLSNDSGPMHLAVGCGVPTVAVFGPTTRELGFFPYGPGHAVIEKDLECRPCGLHGHKACPLGHFHCMRWIAAEEVFDAVKARFALPVAAGEQGSGG